MPMRAFCVERGGFVSHVDANERQVIRGLAYDVGLMLGVRLEKRAAASTSASLDENDPLAPYAAELGWLAGYDEAYENVEKGGRIEFEEKERPQIPMDDAIARLLPDMSENPELARELRSITQTSVASAKADHLALFFTSLSEKNGTVWVRAEDVGSWLAACNDIRIVLAVRLGIEDDDDSEEVYRRAASLMDKSTSDPALSEGNSPWLEGDVPASQDRENSVEEKSAAISSFDTQVGAAQESDDTSELLSVLYSMLSWWQESLLGALIRRSWRK